MSEIEVGEYIRTKGGYIGKVEHITKGYKFRTTTGHIATGQERYLLDNRKSISKPYVTKHSKNIIDLIEAGDFINGDRVTVNKYGELFTGFIYAGGDIGRMLEPYAIFIKEMEEDEIDTILTHEKYEQNCYRVGDIE